MGFINKALVATGLKTSNDREIRKRKYRNRNSNVNQYELLEEKQLLATVSFDASSGLLGFTADAGQADLVEVSNPSADSLQIVIGNGDSIALQDDAAGNPDFVLSTTNVADDTLVINLASVTIGNFQVNLGDLDDVFTALGVRGVGDLEVNGEAGADTIDGSAVDLNLTLIGGAGNDTLTGGSGDDTLLGGGGTDLIDGGDGIDTNSFQGIGLGVSATVNADGTGSASYGSVNEDFTGIENLTGSENDDVLIATGAATNTLRGEGGNDVLAGGGGTDTIDGGDGIDTNSFIGIGTSVTATINEDGTGTATYGPVSEVFAGIENLTGSDNDDILTGNSLVNTIDGGLGNDQIFGLGGNDLLFGGSGSDTISGGDGNDRVVGGFGDDILNGDGGDDSVIGNGQIEVTLTNLNPDDGSLLTPIVVATQNGIYDQFDVGSAASENIERLAEDGIVGPRIEAALNSGGVNEAIATPGLVAPGQSFTLTFFADPTNELTQYLSYASMVIPSNDAFIGNDDPLQIDLFDADGNLIRRTGDNAYIVTGDDVYDAGTEVNDEVPENTAALAQAAPDTGATENGVIRQHPGFQGSERLGGPIGNVLAATPGADFTRAGFNVLSIEVDSAARETGFSLEVNDQPFTSLTTGQSSQELIEEALAGNLYFNVHTQSFPGGEIRGQLNVDSDSTASGVRTIVLTAALDGAQEPNNASDSQATGTGSVTIVIDGNVISYSSTLSIEGIASTDLLPVAGISAIHIHNAPAGQNGPVITDIVQDAGGDTQGNATTQSSNTGDGNVFTEVFESDNDTISGGEGADELVGGEGDDLIEGGAGDDILIGGSGDDILRGGNGNDTARGGTGDDALNGGAGNDFLQGNDGDDFFVGVGGTDVIAGGDGIDVNSFQGIGVGVTATVNANGFGIASYGSVNETFTGIENLVGSENDDRFFATGDVDRLLIGLGGNDILQSDSGNDRLVGGDGDDILRGGDGDDVLLGQAGDDVHNGGAGNDRLIGAAGSDFFAGLGGEDFVSGGGGVDTNSFQGIGPGVTVTVNEGGSGTARYGAVDEAFEGIERFIGTANDDVFIATGSDRAQFFGQDGDDLLIGGSGNDLLVGGNGNDTINGRAGADTLFGNSGNDVLHAGAGNDFARGDEGADLITGGNGNDRLIGSEGDDQLIGNAGDDFLLGLEGNDSLFGGLGEDELRGGLDDDLLVGGLDDDLLFGGAGDNELIQ